MFNLQDRITAWINRYAGQASTTVATSGGEGTLLRRASLWLLWSIGGFFLILFVWITFAEVET